MGGSRTNREHDDPALAQRHDAEKLEADGNAIAIVDICSLVFRNFFVREFSGAPVGVFLWTEEMEEVLKSRQLQKN